MDEGIGDTFVSVGVKNGAHTSVSISASDSARIPGADTSIELLRDELANLVSFRLRLVEPQLAGSSYSRGFEWTGLIQNATLSRQQSNKLCESVLLNALVVIDGPTL